MLRALIAVVALIVLVPLMGPLVAVGPLGLGLAVLGAAIVGVVAPRARRGRETPSDE